VTVTRHCVVLCFGVVLAFAGCGGNSASTSPAREDPNRLPKSPDQNPVLSGAPPPLEAAAPQPTGSSEPMNCATLCAELEGRGCDFETPCVEDCTDRLSEPCGQEAFTAVACLSKRFCPNDVNDDEAAAFLAQFCPVQTEALRACNQANDGPGNGPGDGPGNP
jgi:hypothetical protein